MQMPVNEQLITLINKLSEKKNKDALIKEQTIKALDALLSVNLSDSAAHAALTKAIQSQDFFWKSQELVILDSGELIENEDLDLIQQAAATQRVLYGLENSDEQVLLGILNAANSEALRAYITKNKKIWNSPNPVDNTLIPDSKLKLIQTSAAQLLIAKKIAATADKGLLKALINASDKAATIQAVKALGVTVKALGVNFEIEHVFEENRALAQEVYFNQVFPTLKSKKLSSVAPLSSVRMKSIDDVINAVFEVQLLPEQQEQARLTLGLRYLEEALESDTNVKAGYIGYSQDRIKGLIKDSTLKSLVTADTVGSLKASMAINLIQRTKLAHAQGVVQLANADPDNLDAFRKALEQLAIKPTDWVNKENARKIHNAVKEKVLQLGVEQCDGLKMAIQSKTEIRELSEFARTGDFKHLKIATDATILDEGQKRQLKTAAAHQAIELRVKELSIGPRSSLLNALKLLSTDKLLILLTPENKDLEHLLHATDPNIVRHYCDWQVNEATANKIVNENNQEAYCRQIRNSALAKVFANSDVELNDNKVFDINRQIENASDAKSLIDWVERQRRDGLTFEKEDKDLITTQFLDKSSLNLQIQHSNFSPSVEKVLTVLANLNTPFGMRNVQDVSKSISTALEIQKDAEGFIKQLLKSPAFNDLKDKAAFEKELTNALSATTYESIRNLRQMEVLDNTTPAVGVKQQNAVVAEITAELDRQKNTREELLHAAKGLTSIPGLKRMQGLFVNGVQGVSTLPDFSKLSGAMLDAKIRANAEEWKTVYKNALESNSDSIDFLSRSCTHIQSYLDKFPKNPTNPNIINLQKKLELELKEIDSNLTLFQEAQKKIVDTLQTIDRVARVKAVSVYTNSYIQHKELSEEDLKALETAAGKRLTVGTRAASTIDEQVMLKDSTTHASVVINNNFVGEFTQTFGVIHYKNKPNQSTFELAMTKDLNPKASKSDQAAFYMTEALSIIKANGGPPTKDKPLYVGGTNNQYVEGVWTALHLICEKKYGYRHSTYMQVVKIDIGGFDPDKVVDNTMLRGAVFKDNSMYKTIFEPNKKVVDELLKDVDKIKAEIKANQTSLSSVDSVAKGLAGMQDTIKKKLHATKNQDQSRAAAGPDPEATKFKLN